MLGPLFLQQAPVEIVRLMQRLQEWTIREIVRRITDSGVVTSTAEYQLTLLMEQDVFDVDFKKEIQRILNLSDIEINKLFNEAANANYIYDRRAFQARGIPFVPFEQNYFVRQMARGIIENTQGSMVNITRSMGFSVRTPQGIQFRPIAQFYQSELDSAIVKVASGVQTFEEAIKEAVVRMSDSGLRTVDYESGHVDRIDVAARRAVMGGMRDLTNRQSEFNAEIMESTVFEISWHGGHRPSHAWGGRRFEIEGILYPTEDELYKKFPSPEGIVGALEDYNCYHEKYAVFSDSPPTYSDEELDRMEREEKKKKRFEGKEYDAYEARQQQRYLERCMRKQKSVIAGFEGAKDGGADVDKELRNARLKMGMLRQKYGAFSDAMGIPKEMERVVTGLVA